MNIIELRRSLAAKRAAAQQLVDQVNERDGIMTAEESTNFETIMGDAENLQKEIQRRERLEAMQPGASSAVNKPDPSIGMSDRDVQRYSLRRAILAAMDRKWEGAELEREASEATAKRLGIEPQGFFVPYDLLTRDLTKGTNNAGGFTVETSVDAGSFIDMLRNAMVVQQAGAMVLSGLTGDLAIPKQTGGATAYWVAEGNAPTESQQTLDQVVMRPKTLGAFTDYSRKLMLQSSIDVERFVRSDLASVLALAVDYAALHGDTTGNANQPNGIEKISGVGAPTGGLTWAGIVAAETAVSVANAAIGRLAYITNAKARGKLKNVAKVANTDSLTVWTDSPTPLNGYRTLVTNQVRSNAGAGTNESFVFFGNWADLMIAFWSGIDIIVDPYTASTTGTRRVVALQDCDIAVRNAASFAFVQGTTA